MIETVGNVRLIVKQVPVSSPLQVSIVEYSYYSYHPCQGKFDLSQDRRLHAGNSLSLSTVCVHLLTPYIYFPSHKTTPDSPHISR